VLMSRGFGMLTGRESLLSEHPVEKTGETPSRAPLARMRDIRVAGVVAITAILYGSFVAARLAYHGWDPSFFVVAGDDFCEPLLMPKGLLVNAGDGYDGQFYYRLALHPFTKVQFDYGIALDDAPYRQQRILYPLFAYLLGLGQTSWIPWSMILANYFAICLLAFSAARLAELFGISAGYGLTLAFYPGLLLAVARDLTDVLSISLLLTSLFLLQSRRGVPAAVMLALAVLTRETAVLLAGVLFVDSAWRAMRGRSHWKRSIPWILPLATYVAWQLWLFATWRHVAALRRMASDSSSNLSRGLPFNGLISAVSHTLQSARTSEVQLWGELLLIFMIAASAGIRIFRSSVQPGLKLGWLVFLLLVALLSQNVWVQDWAFLRGTADFVMLSLIIIFGAQDRRLIAIVMVPTMVIWSALAVQAITNL
jgi:hypothetical protein